MVVKTLAKRKLIAGNWKMNGSAADLAEVRAVDAEASKMPDLDVALCLPFTLIRTAAESTRGVWVGGQDCHQANAGAHTGCVSPSMLVDAGAELVIVGHSERRRDCGDTDEIVRAKAEAALKHGLRVILCVGENEATRVAGAADQFVAYQLAASLPQSFNGKELIVAYEPVWAIGTGNAAAPDEISRMHGAIRTFLGKLRSGGDDIRLLYGGSCGPDNCTAVLEAPNVDGMLVGGASLRSESFIPMIRNAALGSSCRV